MNSFISREWQCAESSDNITPVSTFDRVAQILESVQPASDAVFDALDAASPVLTSTFGQGGSLQAIGNYGSTRTHVARALVHRELARLEDGAMGEWSLVKDTGPNCPVWLENGAHSIRVLHTWNADVVPPTGRNPSRVSYFSNSLLEDDEEVLFSSHKFLLLWEQRGADFALRLVHTLGAVRLNRRPALDLNIYLERGVAFSDMAFEQRDVELDYFAENVEEEGEVENG